MVVDPIEPRTANREPRTANREPRTANREPRTANDSEPRTLDRGIRARPAALQIRINSGRRLSLPFECQLQADERPAVVGVMQEIDAVDALCVCESFRLEKRCSQPMTRR